MKGFSVAVALLVSAGVALAGRHHEKRTTHTGRCTWFNLPEGNDACGQPVPDGALAVHVSKDIWNNGKNCGQWMSITANGAQSYGMVTGYCETCSSEQIDCTPTLFQDFDILDIGVLTARWNFMEMDWTPNIPACS